MTNSDHFVRADVQAFLAALEAIERPQIYEMPLAEARESSRTIGAMADLPPREVALIRDLTCPGPAGEIPLRLYDPREEAGPTPVICFYHGGGFVIGDLDSYHSLCTEIAAETGLPVVSVDYRLAPEHPFPAAPDDCEAATRWIATSPEELGLDITGLIPMGDSAGGNLVIVTSLALAEKPADVPVALQVPIYPLASPIAQHESLRQFGEGFFLTGDVMAWFTKSYAADPDHVRTYPLLAEDHSRTPPTVVVTAGLDPLRDSGREYAAHLIQQGVDVVHFEATGVIHGFITMRKALPSTEKDMQSIYSAIRLLLERQA